MLPEPITAASNRLALMWAALCGAQSAFYHAHGNYFQGLWTHSSPPADGAECAPDCLDSRPVYPGKTTLSWRDVGGLPELMTSRIRIDIYDGPDGSGFVVVQQMIVEGELWERCMNVGPEDWRNMLWQVVSDGAE